MRIAKLKIKNLFGISEFEADGRSIELLGGNGTGKTSVLDSIKPALTNSTERDVVVRPLGRGHKKPVLIDEDAYFRWVKRHHDHPAIKNKKVYINVTILVSGAKTAFGG